METVINVKNLSKKFKVTKKGQNFFKQIFKPQVEFVTPVKDISLTIKKGEAVAFLGPNGAGKTTTIKMLTGIMVPSEGAIDVLGFTPNERKIEFLKRIGLVMGNKSGLNWDLTPDQSFNLIRQIYNISEEICQKRLERLVKVLDVADLMDKQIRKMSLGERMKMELIGAILHEPEILFLDEPTIGLDLIAKRNIRTFLREIQKESNITILLTSHDMEDIAQVCDRVIVINEGRKVYDDSLNKLMNNYNQDRFIRFFFEQMPDLGSANLPLTIMEKNEESILVKVDQGDLSNVIAEVSSKFSPNDISIESVPLDEIIEDIFNQTVDKK